MIFPIEAICCPPIIPMVKKSPITTVITKIDPIIMPGLHSGIIIFVKIWKPFAPES